MIPKDNILIEIEFVGHEYFPQEVIIPGFELTENAVQSAHKEMLELIKNDNSFAGIPTKTVCDVDSKLFDSVALNYKTRKSSDSLIYVADVGGLLYWLLAKEHNTTPEEWVLSEIGFKVHEFLMERLGLMAQAIVDEFGKRMRRHTPYQIEVEKTEQGSDYIIHIKVAISEKFEFVLPLKGYTSSLAKQVRARAAQRAEALKGGGF